MTGQTARLIVEGAHITDIPCFYAELNRVFMAGEDWVLGESLDALNDMLYGGYGALLGADRAVITWRDMNLSRAALGASCTLALLEGRLPERTMFNGQSIIEQIEALKRGAGKTYFDIVMEVFAGHPRIEIVAA